MKIEYADLLSGDSILVENAGHFRSPYLYELKPTQGIGWLKYMLYLNIFAWDKTQIIKYAEILQISGLKAFNGKDVLTKFDVITLIPQVRTLLLEALSFFMVERLEWNEPNRCFISFVEDRPVGIISRDNFESIFQTILQLNYVGLSKDKTPLKFSSEEAKKKWELAQEFLKKQAKKPTDKQTNYSLGNIISKLCCVHNSYNLLNVYNLTVFQLYDQFFQCCYLRTAELNERVYTIHGGDDFHMDSWLKEINSNNEEGE